MIHVAKSLVIKSTLLLIVLSGLLIGAMQLGAPAVSLFRAELENWIGQQLQRPVRIGALTARWRGIGPEFILKSVEIESPTTAGARLRLQEVRIRLALLDSLRSMSVKTRRITLSKVRLLITRHEDGTFTVGGLDEIAGGESGDSTSLFALPSQVHLESSEIHFNNRHRPAEPLRFSNVDAELHNAGERHQLNARLPFPGAGELELRVDISGDVSRPNGWSGKLYLDARRLAPSRLLQTRLTSGYRIPQGRLDLQLWGSWERGRFVRSTGTLALAQLQLLRETTMESPERRFDIERLNTRFQWQATAKGWRLKLDGVELTRLNRAWPTTGVELEVEFDAQQRMQLLAGASFLRAEDLASLAHLFTDPQSQLDDALNVIQPHSELHNLRFRYDQREASPDWSAQGEIEALNTRPWQQVPGVTDLDAAFWVGPDQGSLQLAGSSSKLEFPGLFRDPLELKTLQGVLGWRRQSDGGWLLQSPDIKAITHDISTRTRLSLTIPANSDTSPFMDLQTDFSDGRAINAHRYYPVGIMPRLLVDWLDRGIVDGKVISGGALVRGPLKDFPFHRTQNGRFEVFFRTEKTSIDYWPGWPRLTDISAEVRFLQNSFDVWIEQGTIFDSRLNAVHGRIDDMGDGSPIVIGGSVTGPLQNNLRILRESPLATTFATTTKEMQTTGDATTRLNLNIPLSAGDRFALNGDVDLNGSTLRLQDWQLALRDIHGRLAFDHNGISAQGVQAKVLGSDVRIDIGTRSEPRKATSVRARAKVSDVQLKQRFPLLDLQAIEGNANWLLTLEIPHAGSDPATPISTRFNSDLRGMRVKLPAPLGKSRDQKGSLSIEMTLDQQPRKTLHLRYRELLDSALQFTQNGDELRITRAAIELGGKNAQLPREEGIELNGHLPQIDLNAWLALLPQGEQDGSPTSLRRARLRVDRMKLGDTRLDSVDISMQPETDALVCRISSKQLAGTLQIPYDLRNRPLRVRLDRLAIDFDPERSTSPATGTRSAFNPAKLPAIDFEAAETKINGQNYGTLQLISRPAKNALELQTLALTSRRLQLSLTGHWQGGKAQNSRFDIALNTKSLGPVLDNLGFPHYIDEAPAVIDGRLEWAGTPTGFSLARAKGDIKIQLGKGRLVNVDPGIGRIFGLVNVSALQRRLSLDFSDLFKKGLAFDTVAGRFELENGDAYTSNFRIVGPAAQVESSGYIGLTSETLDQLVTVTPRLSAALPVAGLIAGGPIGGAAMLLAQGLIGKEFDKASQRQYEVKGPWSDPVMEQLPFTTQGSNAATSGTDTDTVKTDSPQPATRTGQKRGLLTGLKKLFEPSRQAFPEEDESALPGH